MQLMSMNEERWIEIGKVDEIPPLGARIVSGPDGNIAIFRNKQDEIFALRDACPHAGGPLSQGIVHDKTVTCPLHNWKIELETGTACFPDEGCTNVYDVKVEDGVIFLNLA